MQWMLSYARSSIRILKLMSNVYCLDTSGWTRIRRNYPFGNFPSLWAHIDGLANNTRLVSPQQVYVELQKIYDELFRWVKSRKQIFLDPDKEQSDLVSEILKNFPNWINPLKVTPEADPWVIALAIVQNRNLKMIGDECIVVSDERQGNINKPKIPWVCSNYNVKHFSILDLIYKEGWTF